MPLTRANVTRASRVMLPTYVGFFTIVGLNYAFAPTSRLLPSPVLRYANSVMNIRGWGLVFLLAAALMALALATGRRDMYRYALLLCSLSLAVWTVVGILAVFFSNASPAGWVYSAFVLAACFASYRSLTVREVD